MITRSRALALKTAIPASATSTETGTKTTILRESTGGIPRAFSRKKRLLDHAATDDLSAGIVAVKRKTGDDTKPKLNDLPQTYRIIPSSSITIPEETDPPMVIYTVITRANDEVRSIPSNVFWITDEEDLLMCFHDGFCDCDLVIEYGSE